MPVATRPPRIPPARSNPAPFEVRPPIDPQRGIAGLTTFLISLSLKAASLTRPRCPRCGVRGPVGIANPTDCQRDPFFTVRCRACHHEWTLLATDPLFGL